MLTLPSKLLFALVGLATAAAVGYGIAVGERGGIALLAGVAVGAAVLGFAFLAVRDTAPFVPADAPPPDPRATTPGPPARPSAWPLLAALDVGVIAVGAAVDDSIVYLGIVFGLASALGWFGRTWAEHASWTPRVRERVDYRFVVPLGLPVAMVALTVVIAISFSRVLLAVDKEASVVIALVVAVAILAGMWTIAVRPGVGSSALAVLAGLAGISVLGAGFAGAAQGERHFEKHGHETYEVEVVAKDVAFEDDEIVVPADEKHVDVVFTNHDDVFHNVAIYRGEGPEAVPVFNGEGFAGPEATRTYEVDTPKPGTYTFVCDFHPNMKGEFVVE